jgi:DNA-binding NtrC family response regulator
MLRPRPAVLVVDDEPAVREGLVGILGAEGCNARGAADGEEALEILATSGEAVEVVLLDLKMPRRDGISTLEALAAEPRLRALPVVVLTSIAGSEATMRAMKAGAFDHLVKPFDAAEVLRTVERAAEVCRLRRATRPVPGEAGPVDSKAALERELVGRHPAIREVFKIVGRVAATEATVLITGESGTGKELVARALHRHSARAQGPFVGVNCAAIPETLLETELFGHERGAFTGATEARAGRLEQAEGGTLFLDEIGELPARLQPKLLRALQERAFERVGGTRTQRVNVRVLAATGRDLSRLIADGGFREDLFYRLNVVRIDMPPLRARRTDVPELARFFLDRYRGSRTDAPQGFSDEAMDALLRYPFPGNVRELENLVQRAALLCRSPQIGLEDLPELRPPAASRANDLSALLDLPLPVALERLERMLVEGALLQAGGNKSEAARRLGIHRQQLYAKLRELGLEGPQAVDGQPETPGAEQPEDARGGAGKPPSRD